MSDIEFRILTFSEVERLYDTHMKEDFPPEELKPLSWIVRLTEEGHYQPYGCFDRERLIAYAFFWQTGEDPYALLDYFAVFPEHRNRGVGGEVIRRLIQCFTERGMGIALEAEAPIGPNEMVNRLRRRRLAFYERNGVVRRDYCARIFGVPYVVMTAGPHITDEALMDVQRKIYHSVLDDMLYERQIHIPEELP